jgi:YD repeat-containing protein
MVLIMRCKYNTFNNCAPPHSNKKQTYTGAEGSAIGITAYSDGTRVTVERDRAGNIIRINNGTGTIRYEYDAENRLVRKGDIVYANDKDGNTLSEKDLRYIE